MCFVLQKNSGNHVEVLSLYLLRLLEKHNALQLPFSIFFFSFYATSLPEYWGIRREKVLYTPLNSCYNSVICCFKGNSSGQFFFYAFPAKENVSESIW